MDSQLTEASGSISASETMEIRIGITKRSTPYSKAGSRTP